MTTPPTSRPITMEDVQRIVGTLTLELELLRRENAALRAALLERDNGVVPAPEPT